MQIEMTLRNWPRFRIISFLAEAGGEVTESLSVTGTGWTASIEALEPDKVGIVNIPIDRLVIEGDEPAVERVHALIRRRTERRRRTKYE